MRSSWFKAFFLVIVIILIIPILFIYYFDNLIAIVYPYQYQEIVDVWAAEYQVDPLLVLSVMKAESRFNEKALSAKGAVGLMQLMPSTAEWIGEQLRLEEKVEREDLYNPDLNIRLGTWYLSTLNNQFSGRTHVAIASYNAGQGKVQSWLQQDIWNGTINDLESIPFRETRTYLLRVTRNYTVYQNLYGERDVNGVRFTKNLELIKYLLAKAGF